ncbi:coenzyme A transporter [Cladophialophora chaetospira]|uniref:Mitochondrial thiamine pyrophosphate carrier 1 n=1 Tax=Cladophialophora chaetospira TaxID=386627 RepID=A0AA39CM67_9EURO|nr:coenzyme A transporter [Cladophialophora chaetospira]
MESRGVTSRLLEEPTPAPDQSLFNQTDAAVTRKRTDPQEEKELNKRSIDYLLRSGLAGGLAGCAAKTLVGPLDRVKILFQASNPQFAKYTGSWFGMVAAMRDINKQEGTRGLFRGHSATLLRVFPYAGIKFLAYEQIRAVIIPSKNQETASRRFLSGSLAGITSVFFTYPLEVIRVRLAFETKKDSRSSLSRICRQIYHEHPPEPQALQSRNPVAAAANVAHQAVPNSGLANFYRGFSPTLLGMLPYAGMSFLTHDTIGDLFRHPSLAPYTILRSTSTAAIPPTESNSRAYKRSQLSAPAELASGAMAGLVSQTASYPLEVIRRRMQVGGAIGDGHRLSIAETARRIWLERGWRGFFVGLTIGYVKVIPMTATAFYVYERSKWLLGIG